MSFQMRNLQRCSLNSQFKIHHCINSSAIWQLALLFSLLCNFTQAPFQDERCHWARGRQVCTQRQLLEFPKMTDFKRTVTVFFLLYLVSSGLGMSLVRRDLKENSAAARFLSALDKRTELFKRSDCQDTNPDVYFCMFAAFEEQSCETYGRECALSCGFC